MIALIKRIYKTVLFCFLLNSGLTIHCGDESTTFTFKTADINS